MVTHYTAELCSLLCINTAIPVFILQKVMTSSTFIHIKEYQIFSVYLTDPVSDTFTFNFPDIASMRQYAMQRKELTMYETTGDVSEATQIITLSTCADNLTKRLIIHGSYIGESVIP